MLALIAAISVAIYAAHDGLAWFDFIWLGVVLFFLHHALGWPIPRRG